MDEEVRLEPVRLDPPTAPRFRPYYSLLWFSRQLGRVAANPITNVKANVKEALTKERTLPTTEQLLGTPTPLNDLRRKSKSKKDDQPSESLQNIVEKSHEILGEATTIFPFKLFPDTVVVDRTKVTIIKRNFFWSEDVVSIRIEDVLNATSGVDLFFGSLNVSSRVMNSTDHYQIKFLWKRDAMHLKHLIQGYVIAQHNNIDVAHLSKDELIKTLCELGDDTRGSSSR